MIRPTRTAAVIEPCEPRRLMSGVKSGDQAPIYDFSDAFYLKNGIDPTKIAGRPTGDGVASATAVAPDSDHRGIRMKALNGMHDDGGKANFFTVLGTIQATAFTADSAGAKARTIADKYIAYIFPKAGTNTLSPAQKREDEVIPLNNGYFSNDPTNVWREAFVNYVPAALATSAGSKLAQDLIKKNGTDADGTPFLKTVDDIKNAQAGGIVTVTLRANDGSQGAPWFFCGVFKDYTHGAITVDDVLTVAKNANGTNAASSADIVTAFNVNQAGVSISNPSGKSRWSDDDRRIAVEVSDLGDDRLAV